MEGRNPSSISPPIICSTAYQSVVKDPELFLEWLYWTGGSDDIETGELVGFQYTLFQQNLEPGLIGYVNHAAISDVYNSQHPRYRYATLPDQAEVTNGTDGIKGDFGATRMLIPTSPIGRIRMPGTSHTGNVSDDGGHGKNISLNLTLLNDDLGYYLHQPGGVSAMRGSAREVDRREHDRNDLLLFPSAMNTTGTVTIDGREIEVKGDSWFDHQWGGFGRCLPCLGLVLPAS